VERTVRPHIGITFMLVVGVMTAVAATLAVIAKGKHTIPQSLDFSDNWDEVLGI
jgi:hypothetical protein